MPLKGTNKNLNQGLGYKLAIYTQGKSSAKEIASANLHMKSGKISNDSMKAFVETKMSEAHPKSNNDFYSRMGLNKNPQNIGLLGKMLEPKYHLLNNRDRFYESSGLNARSNTTFFGSKITKKISNLNSIKERSSRTGKMNMMLD